MILNTKVVPTILIRTTRINTILIVTTAYYDELSFIPFLAAGGTSEKRKKFSYSNLAEILCISFEKEEK